MKQALLCVSFGTSVAAARESITAVEEALRPLAGDAGFYRAFTSSTIRRILAQRGETVPSVEEAFAQLEADGVRSIFVQPTHLLPGIEYDKIKAETERRKPRFAHLELGRPLLAGEEDIRDLALAVADAYTAQEGERLVLLGHGTDHAANAVYPGLQECLWALGRRDVLVGTVEGFPDYEEVAARLAEGCEKTVRLAPLMLVAGDHARNDMAGPEEDSWKSRLEVAGYTVCCVMQGLGMLKAVQALYHRRAAEDMTD